MKIDSDAALKKMVELVEQDAERMKENAAYGGSWGDGGASDMLEKLEIYRAGVRMDVPGEFRTYYKQAKRMIDPAEAKRYAEYQKLKKEFEDDESDS